MLKACCKCINEKIHQSTMLRKQPRAKKNLQFLINKLWSTIPLMWQVFGETKPTKKWYHFTGIGTTDMDSQERFIANENDAPIQSVYSFFYYHAVNDTK